MFGFGLHRLNLVSSNVSCISITLTMILLAAVVLKYRPHNMRRASDSSLLTKDLLKSYSEKSLGFIFKSNVTKSPKIIPFCLGSEWNDSRILCEQASHYTSYFMLPTYCNNWQENGCHGPPACSVFHNEFTVPWRCFSNHIELATNMSPALTDSFKHTEPYEMINLQINTGIQSEFNSLDRKEQDQRIVMETLLYSSHPPPPLVSLSVKLHREPTVFKLFPPPPPPQNLHVSPPLSRPENISCTKSSDSYQTDGVNVRPPPRPPVFLRRFSNGQQRFAAHGLPSIRTPAAPPLSPLLRRK